MTLGASLLNAESESVVQNMLGKGYKHAHCESVDSTEQRLEPTKQQQESEE